MAPRLVVRVFGVATIGGIEIATVSGFSLLVSGVGIKEIRSWNRISVFLAFFAPGVVRVQGALRPVAVGFLATVPALAAWGAASLR